MKFKGLKPRLQNIFFHLHTVSGIVISFALFIIFYAGAFTIFREEITPWADQGIRIHHDQPINVDETLQKYLKKRPNFDTNVNFSLMFYGKDDAFIGINGSEKAKKDAKTPPKRVRELIKINDGTPHQKNTTIGATLYALHYFAQIPQIGMYLSSLVAFFFFMATVTGVIIHWKNLSKKFYAFIIKGNWQKIWTNLHTVLGVLTLPFQLVYGITGAFFGLRILFFIPAIAVLFNGDQQAAFSTIAPEYYLTPDTTAVAIEKPLPINGYIEKVKKLHPDSHIKSVTIGRYGYSDAFVSVYFKNNRNTITGMGSMTYDLKTGKKRMESLPESGQYTKAIIDGIRGLHFANFGHLSLRFLFFSLAILCCFMILSGVLIWEKARQNGTYTDGQKRFHYWVTKIYLCICLGLVASVPIIFIANKYIDLSISDRIGQVNQTFFTGWLILILSGLFYKKHQTLTNHYLLIGGVLALAVPIVNGVVTGDWFWKTISTMHHVFGVDAFWMLFALVGFFALWKNRKPVTVK